MTIDEAIVLLKFNNKHIADLKNDDLQQLAEWLEELKIYRLAIKQCKESSYMVSSKEFAKHMEEWVKEQLKAGGTDERD